MAGGRRQSCGKETCKRKLANDPERHSVADEPPAGSVAMLLRRELLDALDFFIAEDGRKLSRTDVATMLLEDALTTVGVLPLFSRSGRLLDR